MSSMRETLTKAVSTSLEIAKVLMLARTSPSLPGLVAVEVAPLILCDAGVFSRTPTVSCPRDVTNSMRDCYSNSNVLVKRLSKESCSICKSELAYCS